MPYADVVKISDEEWEFITGDADFEQGIIRILGLGSEIARCYLRGTRMLLHKRFC